MAMTPTTLELSWLRPQAEVDQFVVSCVSAGNQRMRLVLPSEANGTVLTDLMPGVEYVVTVTAERGRAVSYPASIWANTGMPGQGLGKGRAWFLNVGAPSLGAHAGLTGSSEYTWLGVWQAHNICWGPGFVPRALGQQRPQTLPIGRLWAGRSMGKAAHGESSD